MKKILFLLLVSVLFSACSMENNSGTINLNLTDAPVTTKGLTGVYITFTEISANLPGEGDGSWEILASYDEGKKVNLLELTEGNTVSLVEDVELPAGRVNQIRFMLDAPEEGEVSANPGCYLLYDDNSTVPLYIPSGENTGFKAVNSFTIPVNGEVTVTADFDAGKSLVESGGVYKLKPTIRLIVDNQAGRINGSVIVDVTFTEYSVYAYEQGDYGVSEALPNNDGIQFSGAVSSTIVKDDGSYVLAYLAEGQYELVLAGNSGDGSDLVVLDVVENVAVEAGKTTHLDIDLTD